MQNKAYTVIWRVYENLMRSIDYEGWADYIYDISKELRIKEELVLELGAGTGSLAQYLKRYYPNIIITDLVLDMLRVSKQHNLKKVCCNMTSLPFKNKFRFIYSNFDSVNYLIDEGDLEKLFWEVNNLLEEDGIFTFDVSMKSNSVRHQKNLNRRGKYDGIKYIQKSKFDEKTGIHRNIFKVKLKSGEILEEQHLQKIYDFDYYFYLLNKCGLYVKDCLETFTFKNATKYSERVQFVVKKKS